MKIAYIAIDYRAPLVASYHGVRVTIKEDPKELLERVFFTGDSTQDVARATQWILSQKTIGIFCSQSFQNFRRDGGSFPLGSLARR